MCSDRKNVATTPRALTEVRRIVQGRDRGEDCSAVDGEQGGEDGKHGAWRWKSYCHTELLGCRSRPSLHSFMIA